MRQLLKVMAKCEKSYYKARWLSESLADFTQSASIIAMWDSYYEVRRNNANLTKLKTVVSNGPNITFYSNLII